MLLTTFTRWFCELPQALPTLCLTGSLALGGFLQSVAAAEVLPTPTPEQLEFFESRIRPVLVERCQECHSDGALQSNKLKGGLRLDSRSAMLQGGDSGPAIVPGKPADSLLIASLKHESFEMPPSGKLPESVIADFARWVEMGAPDPRAATNVAEPQPGYDWQQARQFWSFQPVKEVAPPVLANDTWSLTDLDRFVLKELRSQNLEPVRPATRREWLRRVTFDLIGLPPTSEEIVAFEADSSSQAQQNVVDRLLASPHYGERWGRHWLDVARYSEDQAHTFSVKPKTGAFRYRDWVIQAFNNDLPYDRFVQLQLAGDLEPEAVGDRFFRLGGLGFLGLGAEYYKNTAREQAIADELDDRVDTVTRGFLGLTVSCARCHDHKYDPIPTLDYYALAGIFNGSNLSEAPLVPSEVVQAYDAGQKRVKEQEEQVKQYLQAQAAEIVRGEAPRTADYVLMAWKINAVKQAGGQPNVAEVAKAIELKRQYLQRWVTYLAVDNRAKVAKELQPLFEHPATAVLADTPVASITPPAEVERLAVAFQAKFMGLVNQAAPTGDDLALLKTFRDNNQGAFFATDDELEKQLFTAEQQTELKSLRMRVEQVKTEVPEKYPVVHVLSGGGQTMPVYIRGNPKNKGELAPKGFLTVLANNFDAPADAVAVQNSATTAATVTAITTAASQYHRGELARAITDPTNPLTARVIVNRVWQHHFGRGLVGTSSNFGLLGDRPSHPELLDWLARQLMESGWSLKALHREIVLSATYQLSSESRARGQEVDPQNIWLWRANRRRLDVEAWRDALLAVSGRLDPTLGGPTTNLSDPKNSRRTVYAKISRHELDGLLRLFDFPDANVTAAVRTNTTVPQQQLFVLNSEFFITQAKAFASRLQTASSSEIERIELAYQLAYGRAPSAEELQLGQEFLSATNSHPDPANKLTAWEQYAQALLAANEFLYVD